MNGNRTSSHLKWTCCIRSGPLLIQHAGEDDDEDEARDEPEVLEEGQEVTEDDVADREKTLRQDGEERGGSDVMMGIARIQQILR